VSGDVTGAATGQRRVADVMGMPLTLALRGRHTGDALADAAWQDVLAVLDEVDRVFSTYRADSVVSRLGRGELSLEECPPEVREVLALGERARLESHGAFDVRRPGPDGDRVLDPSGVVKGWAVDRASRALESLPGTDFCLSAGGDMVCRTKDPDAAAWRVGVEDPHDPQRLVAVVPVRNGAVATSGLAHRGAHIVDARAGATPSQVASVTVVGPDLVWADIDATAAFALGADAVRWLRTRHGRRGLVVWADGTPELFDAAGSAERL
jgi:thiamine biosynthesis lipoprotein